VTAKNKINSLNMYLSTDPSQTQVKQKEHTAKTTESKGWRWSSVVEHLPSMHKSMGLSPSTKNRKEREKSAS
jgi:hypothetical protein